MKERVLLATAPYSLKERYGSLASAGSTLPNLGLLTLAAVLRKEGYVVRIIDSSAIGFSVKKSLEEIGKFHPDVVGLTAVTSSIGKTAVFASAIKESFSFVSVIIGGPHFTAMPERTLSDYPSFDYGIIGEGENAILNLMKRIGSKQLPVNCERVVFRENGRIKINRPGKVIENLDSLPFPAWELLDRFPFAYRPAVFKYKRLPSVHLVSSRGCPNRCIFCDTSVFGHKMRFHSAGYVLEEIEYLIKNFGIRDIIFEDDQFLLKKERVEEICKGLLKRQIRICWSCSGRVNSVSDINLLRLMKRSGCWQINYGIESGNQQILDSARKDISISQIKKAVRLTNKAGILSKGYFIFGLPGETEETMKRTIQFAKSIPLKDISIFMLTPFPGTEIYGIAKSRGMPEDKFEKMNILNVVYVPEGLSQSLLKRYQKRFMKQFYFRVPIIGSYLARLIETPSSFARLLKSFCGLLRF